MQTTVQDVKQTTVPTAPAVQLFALGRVVATPQALEELEKGGESPMSYLTRHVTGDWAGMDAWDIEENNFAVKDGSLRVFSSYKLATGEKLYVITEHDRSVTTLLLAADY